jgi:hypothetical protein
MNVCVCVFLRMNAGQSITYFSKNPAIKLKILGARTDYMKLVPNRGPQMLFTTVQNFVA